MHISFDYVRVSLFIDEYIKKESTIAIMTRSIHFVDDLNVKMLIDMNILESESAIIDISVSKIHFDCEVSTNLTIISHDRKMNRAIRSDCKTLISSQSCLQILIKLREKNLFTERDYLFQSAHIFIDLDSEDDVMTHVVDSNMFFVQIRNIISFEIIIFKNLRLDNVIDQTEEDCYPAQSSNAHLAVENN